MCHNRDSIKPNEALTAAHRSWNRKAATKSGCNLTLQPLFQFSPSHQKSCTVTVYFTARLATLHRKDFAFNPNINLLTVLLSVSLWCQLFCSQSGCYWLQPYTVWHFTSQSQAAVRRATSANLIKTPYCFNKRFPKHCLSAVLFRSNT